MLDNFRIAVPAVAQCALKQGVLIERQGQPQACMAAAPLTVTVVEIS
jgi:hypothetical protein